MLLLYTRKNIINTTKSVKEAHSVLLEHIDVHRTPGLRTNQENKKDFSGNISETSFKIRRIFSGGINYFIPIVKGTINNNEITLKFTLHRFTIFFLVAFLSVGIFSFVYSIYLQLQSEYINGLRDVTYNIKALVIFSIPYLLGILFFYWESSNTVAFLNQFLNQPEL